MEVEPPTPSATAGAGETETAASPGRGRRKLDPVAGGLKDRDPKNWFEVSWRSVSLARQEMVHRGRRKEDNGDSNPCGQCSTDDGSNGRGVEGGVQQRISFSEAPREGTGGLTAGVGGGTGDTGGRGGGREKVGVVGDARRTFQETEASAMRQHARKREDQVLAGGAQNFYKSVRVCGACFRVSAALSPALLR